MRGGLAALLALALTSPALAAAPAPRLSIRSIEQLAQPLPTPYDASADADRQVALARGRALKAHKRLLIDLGGNWCTDCRVLAGIMEHPELAGFLDRHFEIVAVDVGRFDRNLQVPARYGITGRLEGVPSILIVDPRTDRLVNAGRTAALADARHLTPQALADWLAQWAQ